MLWTDCAWISLTVSQNLLPGLDGGFSRLMVVTCRHASWQQAMRYGWQWIAYRSYSLPYIVSARFLFAQECKMGANRFSKPIQTMLPYSIAESMAVSCHKPIVIFKINLEIKDRRNLLVISV